MRGLFIVAIGLARTAGALSYNAPLSAVSRVSSPSMMAKSKALPFLEQPAHLDGSMAGDVGFDPLGLGSAYNMKWMREAELKHGRICMLAFYGYLTVDFGNTWPGAPKVSSLLAHDAAHDARRGEAPLAHGSAHAQRGRTCRPRPRATPLSSPLPLWHPPP